MKVTLILNISERSHVFSASKGADKESENKIREKLRLLSLS